MPLLSASFLTSLIRETNKPEGLPQNDEDVTVLLIQERLGISSCLRGADRIESRLQDGPDPLPPAT
jgi:hypothetical protein